MQNNTPQESKAKSSSNSQGITYLKYLSWHVANTANIPNNHCPLPVLGHRPFLVYYLSISDTMCGTPAAGTVIGAADKAVGTYTNYDHIIIPGGRGRL